mgnify:FL=1
MTNVFGFLKQISAEVSYINSLFVSAFIKANKLKFSNINNLIKDDNIDSYILESFFKSFSTTEILDLEQLVRLFEFVVSPSDRIVNGAIYTPKPIRNTIITQCLDRLSIEKLNNIRVCDISCGCGGFLMDVAEYIHIKTRKSFKDIYKENIFGIDIQDYSVERTKILLSLLALTHGEDDEFTFNIMHADTLDFRSNNWNSMYTSFDVIVGNPPYVCSRNVNNLTKEKMLNYEVSHSGHPDLYIPFFQIAYEMLKDDGIMGYITMNTFIHSINGRKLREFFSSQNIDISIVDFRGYQVFNKKSTYTCLFFLNKGKYSNGIQYVTSENGSIEYPFTFSHILYTSLDDYKGWNLNDNCITERIESIGTPIGKYCSYRHGIATLSNKTYIFRPKNEDSNYYYIEDNGIKFPIEKGICRDIVNSNKLNSIVDFKTIIEKVIYPYYKDKAGKVSIIDEEIMQIEYPCAYAYLLSKRDILMKRDKGKTEKYPAWYAYGRTQSLQMPRYKLFFPKFANSPIKCVLCDDANLLLYNGISFVSETKEKLEVIQKIIESNVFWRYIVKNAKPYSSNYYSLSGVDIKNFGVPNFTEEEKQHLCSLERMDDIDEWLTKFY